MTEIKELVRACCLDDDLTVERSEDGNDTLRGHFAVFNQWTEIRSAYEGHFMERIAPGAFDAAIAARGPRLRAIYDHGRDPVIATKPIGKIRSTSNDAQGVAFEIDLFDVGYVNDLKPAFRSGQMGSSFRADFSGGVTIERPLRPTAWNPDRLPEHTVTQARSIVEFGPTPFPAYPEASAGMRSLTDDFFGALNNDLRFALRFGARLGEDNIDKFLDGVPEDLRSSITEQIDTAVEPDAAHSQMRRQWLASNFYS